MTERTTCALVALLALLSRSRRCGGALGGHRMKDAGWSVYCVPAARIVHHEGGSRRGWPPRQLRAFHEGAFRYYAKHHAPQWWNPIRYVAAVGLGARAAALIAVYAITPQTLRALITRAGVTPSSETATISQPDDPLAGLFLAISAVGMSDSLDSGSCGRGRRGARSSIS